MNGWKTPTCSQRVNSSADGVSAKPPMSVPTNGKPERPSPISTASPWESDGQSLTLSPGQTAE